MFRLFLVSCFGLCCWILSHVHAQPPVTKSSAVAPVAADKPTEPLTLNDILQQRRAKVVPDQILGAALRRGIDFEVTAAIQTQLGKLGFNELQLENLRTAYGIKPLPPPVPGSQLRRKEAERDQVFKKFEAITKATLPDHVPLQTPHLTMWAPLKMHDKLLPELKKIDELLETRYSEPLCSGLDKRTSHIVLCKSPEEAQQWISKHFDEMKVKTDLPGGKPEYLKVFSLGAVGAEFCVKYLPAENDPVADHMVARYVSCMAFMQLTYETPVDALVAGFTNRIESDLYGKPESTLYRVNYGADRDTCYDPRPWKLIAKSRVLTKKLTAVSALLKKRSMTMSYLEYVECWSLVEMLASDHQKFGKLLYTLREEKDGLKAIEKAYGWDETKLTEQWHNHVRKY